MAEARPGWGQKSGTPSWSPTCITGTQVLGPSSDFFLGALARSWVESEQLTLKLAPMWDAECCSRDLTCCTTILAPPICLRSNCHNKVPWLSWFINDRMNLRNLGHFHGPNPQKNLVPVLSHHIFQVLQYVYSDSRVQEKFCFKNLLSHSSSSYSLCVLTTMPYTLISKQLDFG